LIVEWEENLVGFVDACYYEI